MRRHEIRRHARELLRSLGHSSSEVAATLEGVGVRGVPCNPYDCPLSRYLSAIIPAEVGIEEVGVGVLGPWTMRNQLKVRLGSRPRRPVWIDLPPAVNVFLNDFDGGRYPTLAVTRREPDSSAPPAGAVNRPVGAPRPRPARPPGS